ncbi:Hypothetical predicted protein, partial [Marmota monax]
TVQVATTAETQESPETEGVIDSHKRREILSRRPSYRKILNEISPNIPGPPKIEEEKSEEEGTPPNITTKTVPTNIYQTSTGQYNEETELAPSHMAAATGRSDGCLTTKRTQSPTTNTRSNTQRDRTPIKNSEAAQQPRRKKKEYVKCLENRVAVLENQNKTLIEELK